MQRPTHAALGAWSLSPARSAACGDSRRSMELVGGATSPKAQRVPSATFDVFAAGEQLVAAARTWLADPGHRTGLSQQALRDADETIEVASAHFRELDILAGEVAREAVAAGAVDATRFEQVGMMASTLQAYAERLRALLDPETVEVIDAERRLRTGLEASSRGGGLAALVAAL